MSRDITTPKRAVLYARYSSEAQSDSFSIAAQVEIGKDYIKKQGWSLVNEYIDEALSGTSDKRNAFQRMIVDAANNEFDYVVVYAYDRFSRNRYDQVTYKHELRQYGVLVVSVTQPIDHNNPDSVLLESIYEGMAESYSRKLARESVRGSVQAAKNGFWTGGYTPFGYQIVKVMHDGSEKSKLEINEDEKPVVELIYNMYVSGGAGFIEIAKRLNEKGHKPRQSPQKAKSGEKWTSSAVRTILTNQRYTGAMVWGKAKNRKKRGFVHDVPDIVVENCHQAIIDKDMFEKVQSIMASRRSMKEVINQHGYLLSGLLTCKCGQKMMGHSAKSGKYFYYLCNRKVKRGSEGCDTPLVNRDEIEAQITKMMRSKVYTAKNIESVARTLFQAIKNMIKQRKTRLQKIEREIPLIRRKYTRLVDMVAESDDLDMADVAPRIRELKKQVDELESERESIQLSQSKMVYSDADKKRLISDYVSLIKIIMTDHEFVNNALLRKFIDKIEVNYPEYEVTWKLPNPKELITKMVLGADGLPSNNGNQSKAFEPKKVLGADDLVVRAERYQELLIQFKGLTFCTQGILKAA